MSPSYGVAEEELYPAGGGADASASGNGPSSSSSTSSVAPPGGKAFIVRLEAGNPCVYLRKELLWPHLREFTDRAIEYVSSRVASMRASGCGAKLLMLHGHYAVRALCSCRPRVVPPLATDVSPGGRVLLQDAAEAMSFASAALGCATFVTGHSLGRNKLAGILEGGKMTRSECEAQYKIGRRSALPFLARQLSSPLGVLMRSPRSRGGRARAGLRGRHCLLHR